MFTCKIPDVDVVRVQRCAPVKRVIGSVSKNAAVELCRGAGIRHRNEKDRDAHLRLSGARVRCIARREDPAAGVRVAHDPRVDRIKRGPATQQGARRRIRDGDRRRNELRARRRSLRGSQVRGRAYRR